MIGMDLNDHTNGHLEDAFTKYKELKISQCTKKSQSEILDIKITETGQEPTFEHGHETHGAPDGGWGWIVIIGAIILNCFTAGIVRSNGILYLKFRDRFHGSATSTAFIISLAFSVRLVVSPFVSILTNRFSVRSLTATGAVILCSGLVLSAYTPSQHLLYLSFSLLCGVGRSFILTPLPLLLGQYFHDRRSLAFGLASSGISIGGFFICPLVGNLFESYGYQGAFLILGGLALQVLVSSALFRPINIYRKLNAKYRKLSDIALREDTVEREHLSSSEDEDDGSENDSGEDSEQRQPFLNRGYDSKHKMGLNSQNKSLAKSAETFKRSLCLDLSILKDIRFLSFAVANICITIPNIGLFLPSIAKEKELSATEAVSLLSVLFGFNGLSTVLSGFIFDRKGLKTIRPQIYNGATFCQGIAIVLFPWSRTYREFCLITALNGALMGMRHAQKSVVLMDILGVDQFPSSLAVTLSAQTVSALVGPTLSGWLIDIYGSYDCAFYLGSAALLLGGVIMAFGQVYKCLTTRSKGAKEETVDQGITVRYKRLS